MRDDETPPRRIRSFVRREGRLTPGQEKALRRWLPRYGIPAGDEPIDFDALFGRKAPVVFEIGFGNGDNLLRLAEIHPEWNLVGVEVHRPGIGRLLKLAGDADVEYLRVSSDDAVELLTHRIAPASLDRVLLYFPDPWHKKRHHKRRIVQPDFVRTVARALKPGGEFHLATDWENYAEHMLAVLNECTEFENTAEQDYVTRPDERPLTRFEQRGHRLGHGVWDLIFRRR